jgi:hypothetical protein
VKGFADPEVPVDESRRPVFHSNPVGKTITGGRFMGRKLTLLFVVVLATVVAWSVMGFNEGIAGVEDVPRMNVEELKSILGSPDVVVLDVRFGGESAPKRILGSVFENPDKIDTWSSKYPKGKKIVLYCS